MPTEDERRVDTEKRVDQAIDRLIEHFDTVQIIVTGVDATDGATMYCSRGKGNWYARIGAARRFVRLDDESDRIDERRERGEE
jgi:hypothetical protein